MSTSSSMSSMEQLKLVSMENNNLDLQRDVAIWRKSGQEAEEKNPQHKSSLADLFRYTPV